MISWLHWKPELPVKLHLLFLPSKPDKYTSTYFNLLYFLLFSPRKKMSAVSRLQFWGGKEVSGQKKHFSQFVAVTARKCLFFCEQWRGSLCRSAGCSGHCHWTAHHYTAVRGSLSKQAQWSWPGVLQGLKLPLEEISLVLSASRLPLPCNTGNIQSPLILPGKWPSSSGNWEVLCKFAMSEV